MQLRFIGCGDAFGSGGRANSCFHLSGAHTNLLIDCGATSLPALKRLGIACNDVALILITHFHGDHFAGLPFLLLDAQFSKRTRPLVIAGPAGIATRLTQVTEALFEHSSTTPRRFELSVVELAPEQPARFGEVCVMPFAVVHGNSGGPFLGYRIEAEGRVIAYTADTEWTESLIPLGRDADLLIAEAYTFDRPVKNHLSLETLATHLDEIRPKRLVLTHLGEDMLSRLATLPHAAAHDGMTIDL
ncbi:MBL fold metallo-hydrolase [Bradyrhizobium sp. SSBR45G]|uniref:MBL fold metallo-hydrolase n=1 Tax=unclassified Bradyrhizobium TaxID=2631580 RepID=UPI0023428EFE|nr:MULTISPECIES: MBL fold metallo-hydrolase [unclassified Bradyrhizobium]GLH78638.1 MBL fold metallo-hydrolase [Bradyrhizobium sp. SSBR45G]GLH87534.1 MBL fold metallo-hydrolase [Bradyrhizobium sp. SSBR45R]